MNRALAPLLAAALLAFALPARADIAPRCASFDTYVNCAATDVGKECPTGGFCRTVQCDSTSVLKCVSCPTTVADPAMVCQGGPDWGKACGDGGTCTRLPSWCGSAYSICASSSPPVGMMEAGVADTGTARDAGAVEEDSDIIVIYEDGGPPSDPGKGGSTQSGGSSFGCSLGAVGSQAALAGLMLTVGAAALLFDRRRSKSRRP